MSLTVNTSDTEVGSKVRTYHLAWDATIIFKRFLKAELNGVKWRQSLHTHPASLF